MSAPAAPAGTDIPTPHLSRPIRRHFGSSALRFFLTSHPPIYYFYVSAGTVGQAGSTVAQPHHHVTLNFSFLDFSEH